MLCHSALQVFQCQLPDSFQSRKLIFCYALDFSSKANRSLKNPFAVTLAQLTKASFLEHRRLFVYLCPERAMSSEKVAAFKEHGLGLTKMEREMGFVQNGARRQIH